MNLELIFLLSNKLVHNFAWVLFIHHFVIVDSQAKNWEIHPGLALGLGYLLKPVQSLQLLQN